MLINSRLVLVAAVSAVLLSGCSSAGSGAASSTTSPTSGTSADAHQSDVFSLEVGDCLNKAASDTVGEVPTVDCSAPHEFEVFAEYTLADSTYDEAAIGQKADDECTSRFADFIGVAYDDSSLIEISYKPTEKSWAIGDRLITCTVGEDGGVKTVGTLKGAMR
ncbi:hypothetical protein B7R22_15105 [Subtercola boreus]|uniref:Septum formation-related domain-containing protein n=1 Tax=Subtercola boreus TaxID=120213 RepID=A0A3E0VR47_9MICO|nr:septum formation family protein [Subtercola boreus]RFA12454.1 hypothetical protein B7R22_15105 [Subtercola boreus]